MFSVLSNECDAKLVDRCCSSLLFFIITHKKRSISYIVPVTKEERIRKRGVAVALCYSNPKHDCKKNAWLYKRMAFGCHAFAS